MDTPITEKALFAQTRVQQALEAGAHCIDAHGVSADYIARRVGKGE